MLPRPHPPSTSCDLLLASQPLHSTLSFPICIMGVSRAPSSCAVVVKIKGDACAGRWSIPARKETLNAVAAGDDDDVIRLAVVIIF